MKIERSRLRRDNFARNNHSSKRNMPAQQPKDPLSQSIRKEGTSYAASLAEPHNAKNTHKSETSEVKELLSWMQRLTDLGNFLEDNNVVVREISLELFALYQWLFSSSFYIGEVARRIGELNHKIMLKIHGRE